jgi:hypothetical protein
LIFMLITLVDDSVPYNGDSPDAEPLGGAEKAVVGLAGAMVRKGHTVRVINRTLVPAAIDGVSWVPWEGRRPTITEVLIAFRKPSLLQFVRSTRKTVLWLTRPADTLAREPAAPAISRAEPNIVFLGKAHRETYPGDPPGFSKVVPFGLRKPYLLADDMTPSETPVAVVTTHPRHGMDWLMRLWVERVHPQVPNAELHIYSASLVAAEQGREIPEAIQPIAEQAKAARGAGVRIFEPGADPQMADVYRKARVHLYPGSAGDMHCSTLGESQAVGLPGVARPLGAAEERIVEGETGFIAPDDEAFVNLTLPLLSDLESFTHVSKEARLRQRGRSWDKVAGEFEVLFR